MKRFAVIVPVALILLVVGGSETTKVAVPQFRNLFNGKDLKGWVNVNTAPDTWHVRGGMIICSGHPNGVMRTEKEYENYILHVEWMHMEPGGNSGVFAWSSASPVAPSPFPSGIEIQMLELEWPNLHKKDGVTPPAAYVHGELFGVNGVKIVPDNPRGPRSMSIEDRCKGRGEWNVYDVVAVDGVMKLAVNGKFVNGISRSTQKKGYLCLESEGAEIHFRNIKVMELPPGSVADRVAAVP
jgi:3-keto-disaccharide hydrolase